MKRFNFHISILLSLSVLLCSCQTTDSINDRESTIAFHRVKPGETLFRIAKTYGMSIQKIASLNNLSQPYTIYPGQTLRLNSKASLSQNERKGQVAKSSVEVKKTTSESNAFIGKKVSPEKLQQTITYEKLHWRWPAAGEIINVFIPAAKQQGIDIAGTLGQPIFAVADGKVIYAGDGIIGYGNLLIIKHNETFLSAYAHNHQIVVREDQEVKAGEKIAEMGETGTDQVKLHFQIRKHGKPINPLPFLPKIN